MSIFSVIDNLLLDLNDWFSVPVDSFCQLETRHNDDNALACQDGSLVSMIELHGSKTMVNTDSFQHKVDVMTQQLSPYFNSEGHTLQVLFDYNEEHIKDDVEDMMHPARVTAKNLNLSMDGVLNDWSNVLQKWCATERCFIVIWTHPKKLPPVSEKKARQKMAKRIIDSPTGKDAQFVENVVIEISDAHRSLLKAMQSALKDMDMIYEVLSSHAFVHVARLMADREMTSREWRASLPGDPLPLKIPDIVHDDIQNDFSAVLYPRIGKQVFPRPALNITQNLIRIGDTWHASVMMVIPPQNPKPFNVLIKKMLMTHNVPWRYTLLMSGNGLDAVYYKGMLSTFLHVVSPTNKMINKAIDELKARNESGETIIKFKIMFSTSLEGVTNEFDARNEISRRTSELVSAVQGWGNCEVSTVIGDPLLGFTASLPGVSTLSPANYTPAPLQEVVKMLPLTRPASVWRNGSLWLRTPDGKLMPYTHHSSKQASWCEIGVAPMGAGKSVFLNTYNFGFILQPGLTRLPYLSIIDVGPSSSGLIALIKNALPKAQQHYAAYHRLRMTEDFSINPFDTPLGCRKPLPNQMDFLVNFLSLLATELNSDRPQDGIAAIARASIDAIYDDFSDDRNPKLYSRMVDEAVDEAVDQLMIHYDEKTTWWEIVDALFEKGDLHHATRAQRYAVPLLADVASVSRRDIITGMYKHDTDHNEVITDFFWRSCVDAISAYPILRNPTQFDIGEAKVISLDIDEVCPRGGPQADRQTCVMYMLARHIVAGKFFLMPNDVKLMPKKYQAHHKEVIDNIRKDPKRLAYDEFHRASKNKMVAEQVIGDLETMTRESRKWNQGIGLWSQSFEDIPEIIAELATNIYVLGAGSHATAEKLCQHFNLPPEAERAMMQLGKPGPAGANMLSIMKTSEGHIHHVLTSSIGVQALFAFSSTSDDVAVRNALYEKLGVNKTLKLLAQKYPSGTLKDELDLRRLELSEQGIEDDQNDVIVQMTHELLKEAINNGV